MCPNSKQNAISLLTTVETTLTNLGTEYGLTANPIFKTAESALASAITALQGWTPGSVAEDIIQVLNDATAAINALSSANGGPIPSTVLTLVNIIEAGVVTVIGIVSGNSPAPTAPVQGDATPEEVTLAHQHAVVAETTQKVQTLVPGFKRSHWHSPQSQYKSAWDKAVDDAKLPTSLKV